MDPARRPGVTAADIEASRELFLAMAEQVAETEDKIAGTFEQLIASRGDPDGHRGRIVAEARRVAESERQMVRKERQDEQDA